MPARWRSGRSGPEKKRRVAAWESQTARTSQARCAGAAGAGDPELVHAEWGWQLVLAEAVQVGRDCGVDGVWMGDRTHVADAGDFDRGDAWQGRRE